MLTTQKKREKEKKVVDGKSKHRQSERMNSLNGPNVEMQNLFRTACIFKVLSLFRPVSVPFFADRKCENETATDPESSVTVINDKD